MSTHALAWAMETVNEPPDGSELRSGYGSWYRPIAKLLLIALAEQAGTDDSGVVGDFAGFCIMPWISPEMCTLVLQKMREDGLIELYRIVMTPGHPSVFDSFEYILVGAS